MVRAAGDDPRDERRGEQCDRHRVDMRVIRFGTASSIVARLRARLRWQLTLLRRPRYPRLHGDGRRLAMNTPLRLRSGVHDMAAAIGMLAGDAFGTSASMRWRWMFRLSDATAALVMPLDALPRRWQCRCQAGVGSSGVALQAGLP